jgi:hypothetical protein
VDGDIGAVQSRIDVHWYPDYTSGKKITVYPLNIVYSSRFAARCRVLSRDQIAIIAAKILARHTTIAQNCAHARSADKSLTSCARRATSRGSRHAIAVQYSSVCAHATARAKRNFAARKNFRRRRRKRRAERSATVKNERISTKRFAFATHRAARVAPARASFDDTIEYRDGVIAAMFRTAPIPPGDCLRRHGAANFKCRFSS